MFLNNINVMILIGWKTNVTNPNRWLKTNSASACGYGSMAGQICFVKENVIKSPVIIVS